MRTDRTASPRARVAARVAGLLAASLALAGCVAIPTSGPVQRGSDVPIAQPGRPIPQANAPEQDDTPAEIVNGFLTAGAAGLADEFTVARQFLTLTASADWEPDARVLVLENGGGLEVDEREDDTVVVTVPVQGNVDDHFVYSEDPPGAREVQLTFDLTRNAQGQWRISALEDGVVMSPSNFEILYRRVPIYFASQDQSSLVPDLRWFPNENTATYAVEALLAGPSPWLRDGVTTGVPEGAQLNAPVVTISASPDLQATVNLSPDANAGGDAEDINLLQAQLDATLLPLPGVASVALQKGGLPAVPDNVPSLDRDVQPQTGPYALRDDRLVVLDAGTLVPVSDAVPLVGLAANSPAISLDETIRVVLAGTNRLLLVPQGGLPVVELLTGTDLVAPSIDRLGWIWTAERSAAGELLAVSEAGERVPVVAQFLQDRTVLSLRVSRDGARVAVVHASATDGADVVVDVAAVVREGEEGRPLQLGQVPLQVGVVLTTATELAWVDEVTLVVLGTSGTLTAPTAHLVTLGGPTDALPVIELTASIAAGRGDRAMYLVDEDGVLLALRSSSWVDVATGVRDPVFPG
ncbi:MAG: hypothetical protein JWP95_1696 [Actinotalea sp.]|nr:hypothetical protein [Actinotalea sp.]